MNALDDILQQSGVKGMKWGIRGETRATRKRYRSYNKGMRLLDRIRLKRMSSSEARKNYLDDKDKKWVAKVNDDKNIHKVATRTAREFKKLNKEIKEQIGGRGITGGVRRLVDGSLNAAYRKTMKDAYEHVLADQTFSVYKLSPSRLREVNIISNQDGTLKAVIVERQNPKLTKQKNRINKLNHADVLEDEDSDVTNLDGMVFIIIPDEDGFPDEVISPFDDDDSTIEQNDDTNNTVIHKLNDTLQQSGVLGMKWGVHRAEGNAKRARGFIGTRLNSLKRERQWKAVLKEMDALTTQEITDVARRVTLENGLKALSRSKIGTSKDKEDYHQREHMDNEELARKVTRLRAKESLHSAVRSASKEQRAFGEKVLQVGGSLGVKYALTKTRPGFQDIFDTIKNPKASADKAKSDLLKAALERIKKANQPNP